MCPTNWNRDFRLIFQLLILLQRFQCKRTLNIQAGLSWLLIVILAKNLQVATLFALHGCLMGLSLKAPQPRNDQEYRLLREL